MICEPAPHRYYMSMWTIEENGLVSLLVESDLFCSRLKKGAVLYFRDGENLKSGDIALCRQENGTVTVLEITNEVELGQFTDVLKAVMIRPG